ncbi:8-oxoguanine DNA glycosylase OGG fold protein [Streptomyces griseosporeus]|uniref:8-oxoguanine DNA glycosylase OGG fold protein n=1 Tax=Streptomyces griseosporeus TaxID=1910 RepID=UPI0035716ED9
MRGAKVTRQDLADALDAELCKQLLPATAIDAIGCWLSRDGSRYVAGVGRHAVAYVPARWARIGPWPERFADRGQEAVALVSRSEVVAAVRDAVEREAWSEALVASYVWGQGRAAYGPHRLEGILEDAGVNTVIERAVTALGKEDAVAAYRTMRGAVRGLGPAFFTKLLYFLALALEGSRPPSALILDQRVARVVRAHATQVGIGMCLPSPVATAAWAWSDGGWTPHRYGVYLRWMTAAASQLVSTGVKWPDSLSPDLLELALFSGVWDPTD